MAERDLENIWWKIAIDNERAATTKLLNTLEDKMTRLRHFPRLGPRRADLRASSRMLVAGFYLILHETQPDTDEDESTWSKSFASSMDVVTLRVS